MTDFISLIFKTKIISDTLIESGRWQNVERNMRICNLSEKNEIGKEFHYILECNYFVSKKNILTGLMPVTEKDQVLFNSLN